MLRFWFTQCGALPRRSTGLWVLVDFAWGSNSKSNTFYPQSNAGNCEISHPNMCSYYLVRVHTQLNLFAGNKISKESHKTSSVKWCIELVAWFFQTTSRFEKWFMPICRVVRFTLWNFYAIKVSMLPLFLDCGLILLACCVGQYGLGPFSRAVQQEDSLVVNISKL